MKREDVVNYLDEKIKQNSDYIRITFYEIRMKLGLSEEETDEFIRTSMDYLSGLNYSLYPTNARYCYKGANQYVQMNELLIAFKENY